MFLGTPHRGLGAEDNILPVLLRLVGSAIPSGEAPILDAMNAKLPYLDEMRDFVHTSSKIGLVCAYEKQNQETVSNLLPRHFTPALSYKSLRLSQHGPQSLMGITYWRLRLMPTTITCPSSKRPSPLVMCVSKQQSQE